MQLGYKILNGRGLGTGPCPLVGTQERMLSLPVRCLSLRPPSSALAAAGTVGWRQRMLLVEIPGALPPVCFSQ